VAYSGGRDSTALLHATATEAVGHGVRVLALHVHHGLSAHADMWLSHCEAQCRRWARRGLPIEFVAHRVETAPRSGDSVEAWARQMRYDALRFMAQAHGSTLVLLAHHRGDQAETLLLQALRGAGTAGLSAMPHRVERDGIWWVRPWLDRPSASIDAYVRRHRLRHIEDDSNADPRFARNRLRLQVWPALTAAFPQAEAALATTARWAQEAHAALDELAQSDLERISDETALRMADWLALSPARRSNALRAWLKRQQGDSAPATLVERLLDELPTLRSGRWPTASGELRLYRGSLRCEPIERPSSLARETSLSITHPGVYPLPGWNGSLQVDEVPEMGVPMAWIARLEPRQRSGAERYQAGIGRPPRSLKKQFQEAGVPAWARNGPLLYSGGQLVFVPGLGLDARVIGLPGQPQVTLRWRPG
jgi:tRNA(Ile)-lysidine synthase